MHYFIDGYNLLFRSAWRSFRGSLEKARSELIEELNCNAELLHLTITLVFDAPFLSEELQRGHFRALEIIYSSHGKSADETLIELLYNFHPPKDAVLVSSDKELRYRARALGVQVESVDGFLSSLRKRSRKKQNKLGMIVPKKIAPPPPVPQKQEQECSEIPTTLPPLADYAAWEKIFQHKLRRKDEE